MSRSDGTVPQEPATHGHRRLDLGVMILQLITIPVAIFLGIRDQPDRTASTILIWVGWILLGAALFTWVFSRRLRPLWRLLSSGSLMSSGLVLVLLGMLVPAGVPAVAPGSHVDSPSTVVASVDDYRLRPSSSIATNDQDKIDLDTGEPGWGDISIKVGPDRRGELADIVVEADQIHPGDKVARFLVLESSGSDRAACTRAFADSPGRATSSIARSKLTEGTRICVRTDKDNISLVTIVDTGTADGGLVLNAITWTRG
jgi:hypothetical protein